jgi:uncharacterized membrane protein
MSTVEQSVDVEVPVRTAYNQWTQFEEFPRFMAGVDRVEQTTDTRLHWVAEIAGVQREWDAEITEQIPDRRIAWKATSGAQNDGVVDFDPIDDAHTRVRLQLDFDPQGFVETAGDALGIVRSRVHGDLERFRDFIEARGRETGGWRGTVDHDQLR